MPLCEPVGVCVLSGVIFKDLEKPSGVEESCVVVVSKVNAEPAAWLYLSNVY